MKPVAMFLASVMIAGTALMSLPASSAVPADIIAARRANQKRVSELVKGVDAAVKANTAASALLAQVKEIDDRAKLIKGYFPAGTDTGDTKARPEIWSNRAGFDAAADRYVAEFDKLLSIAQAGDTAGFGPQWEKATSTCGACHRDFRNR
jgi:cytochrome c556